MKKYDRNDSKVNHNSNCVCQLCDPYNYNLYYDPYDVYDDDHCWCGYDECDVCWYDNHSKLYKKRKRRNDTIDDILKGDIIHHPELEELYEKLSKDEVN